MNTHPLSRSGFFITCLFIAAFAFGFSLAARAEVENINPGFKGTAHRHGDGAVLITWKAPPAPAQDSNSQRYQVEGYDVYHAVGAIAESDIARMCAAAPAAQLATDARAHLITGLTNGRVYTIAVVARVAGRDTHCTYLYHAQVTPNQIPVQTATHRNPDQNRTAATPTADGVRLKWRKEADADRYHIYHTKGYALDTKKICTERPNATIVSGDRTEHTFSGLKSGHPYTFVVEIESNDATKLAPQFSAHCDYAYRVFVIPGDSQGGFGMRDINPGNRGASLHPGDRSALLRWTRPRDDVIGYRVRTAPRHLSAIGMCADKRFGADPQFREIELSGNKRDWQHRIDRLEQGQFRTFMVIAHFKRDKLDCNYLYYGTGTANNVPVHSASHRDPAQLDDALKSGGRGAMLLHWRDVPGVRNWHVYIAKMGESDVRKICTERPRARVVDAATAKKTGGVVQHTVNGLTIGLRYSFVVEAEWEDPRLLPPEMRSHCDYMLHATTRIR